ncbi:MAG: hypothetical protein IJV38_12105 [Prevotella sp.]|nr:hypothetical protein [Prevotella sp.]
MKRITNYLIAMGLMTLTFTSCADVPSPYGEIVKPATDDVITVDPVGTGTEADPFNVAAVTAFTSALADGDVKNNIYTKGYICQIDDIDTSGTYGNSTYWISDDAEGKSGKFEVYRGIGLGGQKFNEPGATIIKVGDQVVIKGNVKNFKGNTPEYDQGSILVELNGKKAGDKPDTPAETIGTKDEPITVTKAVELISALADNASTEQEAYVTGKITKIKTADADIAKYKNIDYIISDGSKELTVFRGKNVDNTDFTEAGQINVGDEVVVIGKLTKFVKDGNTTPEVAQGNYIVKLTKGSGGEPEPVAGDGDGSKEKPYTVTQAMAAGSGNDVYVKAFIVGSVSGQVLASGAKFSAESDAATNILIAASASETNVEKCMPVQLPSGAIRTALNLVDNKGNYKKEVTLYGNIEKYFGAVGLKSVSFAILDGQEIGTNPDGGSQGGGSQDGIKKVSVAEFNAAAESTDVWYELTGTISNLKDGDQYGNFDLTDNSGSVYVYGVLSEKGGAKKLFQNLVKDYGVKNGSTITIVGNRGSFNGKIQVSNAYFVSVK